MWLGLHIKHCCYKAPLPVPIGSMVILALGLCERISCYTCLYNKLERTKENYFMSNMNIQQTSPWSFQEPDLEVPTTYKAYVMGNNYNNHQ